MPFKETQRTRRLMKQLNIPTLDQLRDVFEDSSESAAKTVAEALKSVLKEVQANSRTGALSGYSVLRIPAPEVKVRLPKANIDISGEYEWIITVEAPGDHQSMGLHLFNLLDKGRPGLDYREKPYPLWGAGPKGESNARIKRGSTGGAGGQAIGGKNVFTNVDFRPEPRKVSDRGVIRFTRGPIPPVMPLQLYDAALRRAKDLLSQRGLAKSFDVIYIGSVPNG